MELIIDGQTVEARPESTILEAALEAEMYIPAVCYHPDLPTFSKAEPCSEIFRGAEKVNSDEGTVYQGCGLCIVKVEGKGEPVLSCETKVEDGMIIKTNTEEIKDQRQEALATILKNHPRACLLCAQKEGCSREPCSEDVPMEERCCPLLGNCELEKIADFVGAPQNLGKYRPLGIPLLEGEPLFKRDYNLCIGCMRCVRACKDLRGIEALGYVIKNGTTYLGTINGPKLKEAGCRFCAACVEVCPTGALTDIKPFTLSEKEKVLVPCRDACPAGIDVPAYVRAIGRGETDRALSIVYESAPLPGILGMVCHHPCEVVCRRKEINEPISICDLKRFAAENGKMRQASPPPVSTGRKVAVIGSGPAGLSTAHFLMLKGHQVTVFEREEKPGGMLRYGIPAYRLPYAILDSEISAVLEGIELKTEAALGQDFQLKDLADKGFDCVFISTGAGESKKLEIPGSDGKGVYLGVDFLKEVNKGGRPALGENVAVIGGGNVAFDVALCCLWLGARQVTIVCLECESEMPAFKKEIDSAREEAVRIMNCWGPKEIECADGRVKGVFLKKCTEVFDKERNFCPQYDESVVEHIDADNVILSIGQEPNRNLISLPGMPEHDSSRLFKAEDTRTNIPTVFAGGDATRGPSSVIEAIADGRKAADEIDRFLGGGDTLLTSDLQSPNPKIGRDEQFCDRLRVAMPCADPSERKKSFTLIELGYGEKEAGIEANRCLQCDLRLQISEVPLPPEKWILLDREGLNEMPEREGVYQLADEKKMVTKIAGTQNLLQSLTAELDSENGKYFWFEEDPMYTKRESELIQQHLQKYGELPVAGEEDLDDLF